MDASPVVKAALAAAALYGLYLLATRSGFSGAAAVGLVPGRDVTVSPLEVARAADSRRRDWNDFHPEDTLHAELEATAPAGGGAYSDGLASAALTDQERASHRRWAGKMLPRSVHTMSVDNGADLAASLPFSGLQRPKISARTKNPFYEFSVTGADTAGERRMAWV